MIISYQQYRFLTAPLLVLLSLASALPAAAQSVDIEAAKREGKVIVYAAVPPQTMKVINEPFEKNMASKSITGVRRRPAY
jgi:hypothetical protein